ncbi:RNA pseudouridine synthase [Cephaloticoccus primus]|uniref:Pseudouridine synthase n=1 Tax=Cephaloticoccus primus TaxID=1548207 RepID=A0A139SKV5_9BACT|nr:RNA pseudouridine synthase [Cephaloticoccus primus]
MGAAAAPPGECRTLTVPDGIHRARADKVLAAAFPEHSRVAWQRALSAGLVQADGAVISQAAAVSAGQVLRFRLPETQPLELRPVSIPLNVLFEDEHLLAVNKASGMVVHPGAATGEDTLVHALLAHCAGSLSGIGGVERPGIVHRLDRETSGVILVAKTDAAHRGLSGQFAERRISKHYLALVSGRPQLLSGTLKNTIGRNPNHRHKMALVPPEKGGKPAHTDWEVAESFGERATLMRCQIHTGRTHQIRVHMQSLGHVILGDVVYGWKPDPRLPVNPERVMLHAGQLTLTHPITQQPLDLHAPVPADMERLIKALR